MWPLRRRCRQRPKHWRVQEANAHAEDWRRYTAVASTADSGVLGPNAVANAHAVVKVCKVTDSGGSGSGISLPRKHVTGFSLSINTATTTTSTSTRISGSSTSTNTTTTTSTTTTTTTTTTT